MIKREVRLPASPVESSRFPLAFAAGAVAGNCAGMMDRDLPPFHQFPQESAAITIFFGTVVAVAIYGRDIRWQLFPYLVLTLSTAAITSAYCALRGTPTLLELGVLNVGSGLIFILSLRHSIELRKAHANERASVSWKSARRGAIAYALLTVSLSWSTYFMTPHVLLSSPVSRPHQLLIASASYAMMMGWQPLLALFIVRRWIDPTSAARVIRLPGLRHVVLAVLAPAVVFATAVLINRLMTTQSFTLWRLPFSENAIEHSIETNFAVAAICGALALLWIQALTEEIGWRGYFLESLMMWLGPRAGLVIHGTLWGLWYAPLLLATSSAVGAQATSSLTFVGTSVLLGSLLGWLRCASHSVLTSTLANSILTILAGLPLVLSGQGTGIESAAYGPTGWIPLGLALAVILCTRQVLHIAVARPSAGIEDSILLVTIGDSSSSERDPGLH